MNVARLGLAGLGILAACRAEPSRASRESVATPPVAQVDGGAAQGAAPPSAAGEPTPSAPPVSSGDRGAPGADGSTPAKLSEPEPHPERSVDAQPARVADAAGARRDAQTGGDEDLRRTAIRAIEAGDFTRARDVLEDLIVGSRLEEAVSLLDQGRALDALSLLEDVRAEAPGRRDALLPFAEASLRGGRELGEAVLVERALEAFSAIEGDPAAAFGASRAAAALGRTDEALRFAREGIRRLDARGSTSPLTEPGERTWAQAALDAFYLARANQSAEADALRTESEDALSRYLGTNSADGWIWEQIGKLAESDGRVADAAVAYERGLHRASSDAALADGLWRCVPQSADWGGVRDTLTRVLAVHPEVARLKLDLGITRVELALAQSEAPAGTPSPAIFAAAEADLVAAREADPTLAEPALGWQAICRAGLGWAKRAAGDLVGARAAFESMEALFEGGLLWSLDGRVRSGLDGLVAVGDDFQKAGDLAEAAATFERLFAYQGDSLQFASRAGFFDRDLAVELSGTADDLERAARGEVKDAVRLVELRKSAGLPADGADDAAARGAFAAAAARGRARAAELHEKSFAAYAKAVELAPDDVRTLNDAARMLVHYLHRDWDRARAWLAHAVEVGERELADPALDKDRRLELQNAWGDAHENLGVLALQHDRDAASARKWFQRAVEIGPDPRPMVTDLYLKQCDELEARR
jgi:tetratricopeptide (TPR) repeat protein